MGFSIFFFSYLKTKFINKLILLFLFSEKFLDISDSFDLADLDG